MKADRREWDEGLIRTCLYPHDAEEVLKIRLTNRNEEDFIARHYEKSEMFSVRSAYKLALQPHQAEQRQEGSSRNLDGSRALYKEIWSAKVPPKVRIFAWRLLHDGLATQCIRMKRTLTDDATCQVCGREEETAFHAVIRCTKATALRHEMRKHWLLPEEKPFVFSGPDWLLSILSSADVDTKAKILMLLWRAWHLRNDMIHGKGKAMVTGSALFLKSYGESLNLTERKKLTDLDEKGKEKIPEGARSVRAMTGEAGRKKDKKSKWEAPEQGWIKVNVDAGYNSESGQAGAGVIARDEAGLVVLSAWKFLSRCSSPEEAEAMACLEGIRLAVEWMGKPTRLESDCLTIINCLREGDARRAAWSSINNEIIEVGRLLPACTIRHTGRDGNRVAHLLAKRALERSECVVLRYDVPLDIRSVVLAEATSALCTDTLCPSTPD
jgi:ribonuclease HI